MLFGYQEAQNKITEMGRSDVNKYKMWIKFTCTPSKTISAVCSLQERNEQTKGVRREPHFILKKYLLQDLF